MGHSNKGRLAINKHIDVVLMAVIGSPFLVYRRKDNNRNRRHYQRGILGCHFVPLFSVQMLAILKNIASNSKIIQYCYTSESCMLIREDY
jgi:hypothetical protein